MAAGAAAGVLVALANGVCAWAFIRWACAAPPRLFAAVIVGGMALRIAAVTLASVALLRLTALPAGPYLGGLAATVLVVQGLEVALILRTSKKHKEIGTPDAGPSGPE